MWTVKLMWLISEFVRFANWIYYCCILRHSWLLLLLILKVSNLTKPQVLNLWMNLQFVLWRYMILQTFFELLLFWAFNLIFLMVDDKMGKKSNRLTSKEALSYILLPEYHRHLGWAFLTWASSHLVTTQNILATAPTC